MENTLLVGLSRQVALRRELDVVANNVANLNTNGFKADGVVFREYLMPVARANNFQTPDRRLSFVHDRATFLDLGQGAIQQTGNPLDVAIDGNAFLAIQTPRGERYTRNGALQINATGELVTSEGYQVLGDNGPIRLQSGDKGISISRDGTVSVQEGANTRTDSARGKIRMVTFAAPQRLEKDSSSTFMAPGQQAQAAPLTMGLVQGALEKSNVHGVVEMTRLIELTRSYTNIASLIDKQGELRRTAIERLADVPA
jgi:flagellar basal-body rod protein FlgF/flagellar basal-body rod protein FlgG